MDKMKHQPVGKKKLPNKPDYHHENMSAMTGIPHAPHDRPVMATGVHMLDMSGNLNPVAMKAPGLDTTD